MATEFDPDQLERICDGIALDMHFPEQAEQFRDLVKAKVAEMANVGRSKAHGFSIVGREITVEGEPFRVESFSANVHRTFSGTPECDVHLHLRCSEHPRLIMSDRQKREMPPDGMALIAAPGFDYRSVIGDPRT